MLETNGKNKVPLKIRLQMLSAELKSGKNWDSLNWLTNLLIGLLHFYGNGTSDQHKSAGPSKKKI